MNDSTLSRAGLYRITSEAYRHPGERAQWTGEKRPPKCGDWYLSGSIIEAYRALADLDTPYHIARLVRVETVTTTRIVDGGPQVTRRTGFVCGTRAVVECGPRDFRVVCATCDGGGTVSYPTRTAANHSAIRDSARPCKCGAS